MFSAPPPNFPGGYTYVFQGTVQEDGTGGTHVCTLTVSPGAGSEMEVLYGSIVVGNTATAQAVLSQATDGTNTLATFANLSFTSAGAAVNFPTAAAPASGSPVSAGVRCILSGSMQLIMKVTTAAVSVTQTFAVVCRMKNPIKPTTTLADTVGTPTLTKNTDALFTS